MKQTFTKHGSDISWKDAANKALNAKKGKNAANRALNAKKGSYSFLTKKSFRVDAPGKSASEAYKVARSKMRHYGKSSFAKDDKLSGTYFKYDKEGLHANEGPYYQYRPLRFRKGK